MSAREQIPVGVSLSADIEYRAGRPRPYRARVRWIDPATRRRCSVSESVATEGPGQIWRARRSTRTWRAGASGWCQRSGICRFA
jgi:hypothetical protein